MVETIEVIHNAMEFANDQLKAIAKGSKEQPQAEDEYGAENV